MRDLQISLKGVRCFAEPGYVRIAPLTLLVGENSTGKSSFLALTRTAWELAQGRTTPNFNHDPFLLGAYDQIAHYRGGKSGRAKHFSIKLQANINLRGGPHREPHGETQVNYEFVFGERQSQPYLEKYSVSSGDIVTHLDLSDPSSPKLTINTPSATKNVEIPFPEWRILQNERFYVSIHELVRRAIWANEEKNPEFRQLDEFFHSIFSAFRGDVFASAPVRTKPARTYDPVDDTPTSEGGHVPMALLKIFLNDKPKWSKLKVALEKFGKASGLFEELSIKSLGHASGADPFQVMVKISGPKSNLVDVGYGISQVLPILVDLMSGKQKKLYLLQQPEVHLHPRAQAELGSFMASFVKSTRSMVVAETHSDYIIDRLRMDIRDKNGIGPDDVSILYFERSNLDVKIHSLHFDKLGNLHGAPESYRSFFMREENRMLGIDDT